MKKAFLLILPAVLLLMGCGNELDTGYRPQKIGVSTDERRSYYAPPFSPEQLAGQSGDEKDLKARKPYNK